MLEDGGTRGAVFRHRSSPWPSSASAVRRRRLAGAGRRLRCRCEKPRLAFAQRPASVLPRPRPRRCSLSLSDGVDQPQAHRGRPCQHAPPRPSVRRAPGGLRYGVATRPVGAQASPLARATRPRAALGSSVASRERLDISRPFRFLVSRNARQFSRHVLDVVGIGDGFHRRFAADLTGAGERRQRLRVLLAIVGGRRIPAWPFQRQPRSGIQCRQPAAP